jgi:hypothetical protein
MEHHKALTSDLTMSDLNNNNNSHYHHHHYHNRRKKRIARQQQLTSLSLSKNPHVKSVSIVDSNTNQERIAVGEQQIPMKNSLSWTKKWTKWFSSCGSERQTTPTESNPIEVRCYLVFHVCVFNIDTCCVYVIDCLKQHPLLFFQQSIIKNLVFLQFLYIQSIV